MRVVCGPSTKIERIAVADAPANAGALHGSFAREVMYLFEELGDVLIPGLDGDALDATSVDLEV